MKDIEVDSGPAIIRNVRLRRKSDTMSMEDFFSVLNSFANSTTRKPLTGLSEPTGKCSFPRLRSTEATRCV